MIYKLIALGTTAGDGQDGAVSPRLPAPPDPPRPHMISVRLSDGEKAQLERARVLMAKHWKRKSVERAEVVRAALAMLSGELERQLGNKAGTTRAKLRDASPDEA